MQSQIKDTIRTKRTIEVGERSASGKELVEVGDSESAFVKL